MNKHIYTVGASVLAFAMGVLPAIALAENGESEGQRVTNTQVTAVTAVRVSDDESASSSDRGATSTARASEEVAENAAAPARERSQSFLFSLEDDEDMAFSLSDLKQKIEDRRQELNDEEASSTTPRDRDLLRNANPVRLAVHALLASRGLLGGGIGEQVSEIARSMNDSVASTTNAEARIQSRGFFSRFLFGGDKSSAEAISQAVERNQQRIDALTALLGEANVSVDIHAVLTAQITALEEAQVRLQALAEKEQKAWGLLSWRF